MVNKTRAVDVASYILEKLGPISAMKLQKLVYYTQAWSLAWEDRPIFPDKIEAWVNGPVLPTLYHIHRGSFTVSRENFPAYLNISELSEVDKETVDTVLGAYADKSAQWLSDQTHSENPWIDARGSLPDNVRGNAEITLESMSEFYSSL